MTRLVPRDQRDVARPGHDPQGQPDRSPREVPLPGRPHLWLGVLGWEVGVAISSFLAGTQIQGLSTVVEEA